MQKLRVHVGLKPDVLDAIRAEAEFKTAAIILAEKLGLENPDIDRLYDFGVLTGDVLPDDVDALRQASEIAWVEGDQERHIF